MKVRVDNDRCTGHARCADMAPDFFELDDLGFNALRGEVEVPAGQEGDAARGVAACPERAITQL